MDLLLRFDTYEPHLGERGVGETCVKDSYAGSATVRLVKVNDFAKSKRRLTISGNWLSHSNLSELVVSCRRCSSGVDQGLPQIFPRFWCVYMHSSTPPPPSM